jgi:chitodextrinase
LDNGKSTQENGDNIWYNQAQGNYWSDYDDIDRDLDGIGDAYYTKEGVLDKYPLGYFLDPPYKPSDPDPSDAESGVGLKVTLKVYVDDPDGDKLTVYFYRADTEEILDIDKRVIVGSMASCSFTLPFDTTFAWYVIANDSKLENRSDTWFFTTKATPPDNEPPYASPGGSYTGGINQAIMFDASESYDPDGEIDFYRWNFGDGTSEILAQSPQHIYQNPGTYDVTLTVIDNDGTSAMEKTTVIIKGLNNQKPHASSGGPYSCETNYLIILDGSESYDTDGKITNYTWEFEDDSTEYGSPATHSFSKAGTYTFVLTVTDDQGATDTTTGSIKVTAKESERTPGFELTLVVLSIAFILFHKRRRK